jgi:hypothetical protein
MGTYIARIIESGDGFKLAPSKADSKAWTGKGIVGRFEPSAEMNVYRDLAESVLTAFLACESHDERMAILADLPHGTANSPVPFTASDLAGWALASGGRVNAGKLASSGIVILPVSQDTDAAIDAMFALAGLDSDFGTAPESDADAEILPSLATVEGQDAAAEIIATVKSGKA